MKSRTFYTNKKLKDDYHKSQNIINSIYILLDFVFSKENDYILIINLVSMNTHETLKNKQCDW